MSALPPVIEAMRAPGFYPTRPTAVELVQTHISYVFLLGSRVYKVKKPVRFAFLDFSTLERRRYFCHEEVRLNRRLARGVYLGVRTVVARDGGFALGDDDAPDAVEYAVEMCRLPANRVLAHLVESGAATAALIDQIAERLVAFHTEADAGPEIAAAGDPTTVARLMDEDFAEVAALHDDTISAADDRAIQAWCHAQLRRHDALLRRRQAEGRVRDGHGDLHAEHIYCRNEQVLQIVDCIEFNPAFRQRDVAGDLAFLAMDLDYRGHPELAERLVATYAARSGDADLPALIPLFACHRAYIRGKVDSLKSREAEVDPADRAAARDSARRHFALARRYTWSDARVLVVVSGLSGSGKSTVAAALAERTGFVHINSDRVRKQLAGLAPTDRGGADLYTSTRSAATYAAMYAAAANALAAGRGAILDATFQRRAHRDQAAAVGAAAGAPVLFVECRADEAVIRLRLAERAARDHDPSDADWEVYRRQRRFYEPVADDEPHVTVDTTVPLAKALLDIEAALPRPEDVHR